VRTRLTGACRASSLFFEPGSARWIVTGSCATVVRRGDSMRGIAPAVVLDHARRLVVGMQERRGGSGGGELGAPHEI
jgi:hypothetical protein